MPGGRLALLDWRRRVAAIYDEARRAGGGADAHARFRAARDELFATHPQSPLTAEAREDFTGLTYFPYRDDWRAEALLDPDPEGAELILPSSGEPTHFTRLGYVEPVIGGEPVRLAVFWLESYGGGLFLPFADGLAGAETYGGGRYLLDTVKGADLGPGQSLDLLLDFNFAYNPSCAYDPRWSCPLSPSENRLARLVPVGEQAP